MVVGARQNLQFFGKKPWFLGNNASMLQFRYRILHNLIGTTKLLRLVRKNQF